MGKGLIIGAIVGVIIGRGVFGLVLGALVGWYFFDRNQAQASSYDIRQLYLQLLFTTMGRLAKADGRVSELEVRFAESVFQHLGLTTEQRQQAIVWFKQGTQGREDWQDLLAEFARLSRGKRQLRQSLLELLLQLALVDGQLHDKEQAVLLQVAQALGMPEAVFQMVLQQFKARYDFHQHQQGQATPSPNRLAQAYQILGVKASDNDNTIKKAYRKLMSQYHPDKLMAQGLPEAAIKQATEKTQIIQEAYALIKQSRA